MNFTKAIFGYFLIAFLLCGYVYSRESDLKFEHIGREKGLTASSILCILQDNQGFMWFGTTDGLFRYDGYGMTAYRHDRLDSTSLGNNNVSTMLVNRSGTIWIGTAGGGLNRFDRKTEQFVRYFHDPNDPNSLSCRCRFCTLRGS
jgi:ligand-binding sensor domain-containing protein